MRTAASATAAAMAAATAAGATAAETVAKTKRKGGQYSIALFLGHALGPHK